MAMKTFSQSSSDQMKTVDRASQRVNSWPEWKRNAAFYRDSKTLEKESITCKPQLEPTDKSK